MWLKIFWQHELTFQVILMLDFIGVEISFPSFLALKDAYVVESSLDRRVLMGSVVNMKIEAILPSVEKPSSKILFFRKSFDFVGDCLGIRRVIKERCSRDWKV